LQPAIRWLLLCLLAPRLSVTRQRRSLRWELIRIYSGRLSGIRIDRLLCWEGQTNNADWNLGSGLEIEHDPCWRVVARVFLPTRPSVNTAIHEPDRQIRREQKVIESHAFVLLPPFKFVIPECPERPVWM